MNQRTIVAVESPMVKPIVYHNIEEKEFLERAMMASIPSKKRELVSKTLMEIFYRPVKRSGAPMNGDAERGDKAILKQGL